MSAPLEIRSQSDRTKELCRLAWPAVLSYILNNAYRVNDQFWIQGLGDRAQAAIGATFFVNVMAFAAIFLAVGGTLALVSHAVGAREPEVRDSITRHALGYGFAIGITLTAVSLPLIPEIVWCLGLRGETAGLAEDYLGTLYPYMAAMAALPVLDSVFIGRGNTRIPMMLQACAVALNYVLNPLLIYGASAADAVTAPGAELVAELARSLGIEGMGIRGAALATGLSRATVVLVGLTILRFGMGVRARGSGRVRWSRIADISRISSPVAFSIGVYAIVYWALLGIVLGRLGDEVVAGLGIGFQVFEGVAFPCYLGVSIAGASLVGREIGARNRKGVLEAVGSTRVVSRALGAFFTVLFWFGGPPLIALFTQDAAVARETLIYVRVLALSQYWVAVEAVNERVLLGSGYTKPILWIAPLGNALRVPLAWLLALTLGLGAQGVWWAINATTYLKAFLLWRRVQEGRWLEFAFRDRSEAD